MKKLYEESSVQAIADAIRAKAGTADTYKIAEMPAAIASIPSGGGATEPYMEEVYDSDGNLIDVKMYGYTKIRESAFNDCRFLNLSSLPDGVTIIGDKAFYYCSSLALSSLPDGITSIGRGAFYYCQKLAIANLPVNLTSIKDNAFAYCSKITSITFNGTPSTISSKAFANCYALTTINVPWAEGAVANAPWGATNATINYNYTEG